jgi:5-formaminoimidazole-4-carboxamide-1-beta-D-ribofuranosyl 5'-monophosphate synthetase
MRECSTTPDAVCRESFQVGVFAAAEKQQHHFQSNRMQPGLVGVASLLDDP